jgi:hypothetical protein
MSNFTRATWRCLSVNKRKESTHLEPAALFRLELRHRTQIEQPIRPVCKRAPLLMKEALVADKQTGKESSGM